MVLMKQGMHRCFYLVIKVFVTREWHYADMESRGKISCHGPLRFLKSSPLLRLWDHP